MLSNKFIKFNNFYKTQKISQEDSRQWVGEGKDLEKSKKHHS